MMGARPEVINRFIVHSEYTLFAIFQVFPSFNRTKQSVNVVHRREDTPEFLTKEISKANRNGIRRTVGGRGFGVGI
jgi:hypothetical protein